MLCDKSSCQLSHAAFQLQQTRRRFFYYNPHPNPAFNSEHVVISGAGWVTLLSNQSRPNRTCLYYDNKRPLTHQHPLGKGIYEPHRLFRTDHQTLSGVVNIPASYHKQKNDRDKPCLVSAHHKPLVPFPQLRILVFFSFSSFNSYSCYCLKHTRSGRDWATTLYAQVGTVGSIMKNGWHERNRTESNRLEPNRIKLNRAGLNRTEIDSVQLGFDRVSTGTAGKIMNKEPNRVELG